MQIRRILIVEDDTLAAMDLERVVAQMIPSVIAIKRSVASARPVLNEPLDFAFLDVDVTNGKTFEIARLLTQKAVPFSFVSGSIREQLPIDLRDAKFIPKPFRPRDIARALRPLTETDAPS